MALSTNILNKSNEVTKPLVIRKLFLNQGHEKVQKWRFLGTQHHWYFGVVALHQIMFTHNTQKTRKQITKIPNTALYQFAKNPLEQTEHVMFQDDARKKS